MAPGATPVYTKSSVSVYSNLPAQCIASPTDPNTIISEEPCDPNTMSCSTSGYQEVPPSIPIFIIGVTAAVGGLLRHRNRHAHHQNQNKADALMRKAETTESEINGRTGTIEKARIFSQSMKLYAQASPLYLQAKRADLSMLAIEQVTTVAKRAEAAWTHVIDSAQPSDYDLLYEANIALAEISESRGALRKAEGQYENALGVVTSAYHHLPDNFDGDFSLTQRLELFVRAIETRTKITACASDYDTLINSFQQRTLHYFKTLCRQPLKNLANIISCMNQLEAARLVFNNEIEKDLINRLNYALCTSEQPGTKLFNTYYENLKARAKHYSATPLDRTLWEQAAQTGSQSPSLSNAVQQQFQLDHIDALLVQKKYAEAQNALAKHFPLSSPHSEYPVAEVMARYTRLADHLFEQEQFAAGQALLTAIETLASEKAPTILAPLYKLRVDGYLSQLKSDNTDINSRSTIITKMIEAYVRFAVVEDPDTVAQWFGEDMLGLKVSMENEKDIIKQGFDELRRHPTLSIESQVNLGLAQATWQQEHEVGTAEGRIAHLHEIAGLLSAKESAKLPPDTLNRLASDLLTSRIQEQLNTGEHYLELLELKTILSLLPHTEKLDEMRAGVVVAEAWIKQASTPVRRETQQQIALVFVFEGSKPALKSLRDIIFPHTEEGKALARETTALEIPRAKILELYREVEPRPPKK